MKVFLLGHKGFIGSHLLPKLIEDGHDVGFDMRWLKTDRWDVVINLAATTHIQTEFDPNIYYNNIILAEKILTMDCRVLYASSCSAKYNTNPYAASKIWAEYLGSKHSNALGFRFHNVFGKGNKKGIIWYLMQQPDGAKITIRGADLVRDYIRVETVVETIMWHLDDWTTGVIDVGSSQGTTTMQLVELYMKLSGKTFEIETIPAYQHEPLSMIADVGLATYSLKDALEELIKDTI